MVFLDLPYGEIPTVQTPNPCHGTIMEGRSGLIESGTDFMMHLNLPGNMNKLAKRRQYLGNLNTNQLTRIHIVAKMSTIPAMRAIKATEKLADPEYEAHTLGPIKNALIQDPSRLTDDSVDLTQCDPEEWSNWHEICKEKYGSNAKQMAVIDMMKAIHHHLGVVIGPPGTGKTEVLVDAVIGAVLQRTKTAVVAVANSAVDKACTAVYNHFPRNKRDQFKCLRLETTATEMQALLKVKDVLDQAKANRDAAPERKAARTLKDDPALLEAVSKAATSTMEKNLEISHLFKKLQDWQAAIEAWQKTQTKRHSDVPNAATLAHRVWLMTHNDFEDAHNQFEDIKAAYTSNKLSDEQLAKARNDPNISQEEIQGWAHDIITPEAFDLMVKNGQLPTEESLDRSYNYKRLARLYVQQEGKIAPEDYKEFAGERSLQMIRILQETDVLFITCNSCGQGLINEFKAEFAVCDEGGQIKPADLATVLANLPTVIACIILGDPHQLLPYFSSRFANEFRENASLSVLGLLQMKNYPIIHIDEQYRSAPEIVQWVNHYVYGGMIRNHSSVVSHIGKANRVIAQKWPAKIMAYVRTATSLAAS